MLCSLAYIVYLASIRYSNTFQQQQQHLQDNVEPQADTPLFQLGNPLKLSPIESTSPPSKPLQSPTESMYKSTLGRVHTENTAYIKEDSDDYDSPGNMRESEEEDDKEDKSEEEEDEEERFSSHFQQLKFEEPAFLPRRVEGSTSSLSTSRHQLSLSIQNLRKPTNNSGEGSAVSPKRILSPQTHSPATRSSTALGSNNESAINSSTSSFSDISETSVTQSAMEDAFLSNFGNGGGSKLYVSVCSVIIPFTNYRLL